jgi:hypothetical protein
MTTKRKKKKKVQIMIFRHFKDQFGFINFEFFSLALQSNNKNGKNVIFLKNCLKIKVRLIVRKIR